MDTTQPTVLDAVRRYLSEAAESRTGSGKEALASWESFYDVYNDVLARFAGRHAFRAEEIEDLLQDVWYEVIRRLPQFEYDPAKGGFRRWLYAIVQSRAIDAVRRRQTERKRRLPDPRARDELAAAADHREPPADDALDRQFQIEIVRAALARLKQNLSNDEWRIFTLARIEGRTSAEVAREVGLTPAAVRNRLARLTPKLESAIAGIVGRANVADCF